MPTRPDSIEKINKKEGIIHIILTGWKDEYVLDHPRYFKLPYSSHSSPKELEIFLKALNPNIVFFNDNSAEH